VSLVEGGIVKKLCCVSYLVVKLGVEGGSVVAHKVCTVINLKQDDHGNLCNDHQAAN
jgi:hypothetical protein